MTLRCLAVLVCLQTLAGGGCGGSSYPTTDLKGVVSVAGQPVESGGITFTPLGADHGKGVYAPLTDGRYEAKRVPVGAVRVNFRLLRDSGRIVEVYGKQSQEHVNILPTKYLNGMDVEIVAAEKVRDFHLDGK